MIHEDEYFLHYLLSLFSQERPLKTAQFINVFHGRRTPSMLYLVEIHQLFSAFELFPKLSREQLQRCFQVLKKKRWIAEKDQGYIRTNKGNKEVEIYFKHHKKPKSIQRLKYVKTRHMLWERFQLISQVVSEMQFNNKDYTPVIKHPSHQESVRIWFAKYRRDRKDFTQAWIKESFSLFSYFPEEISKLFVYQLAGHGTTGKTKRQVTETIGYSPYEFFLVFEDALEQFLLVINRYSFPLLQQVLKEVEKETFYGLTKSTFYTIQLLNKGETIETIAALRRLKVNTIREHILEAAFIQPNFSFNEFIPEKIYTALHKLFEQSDSVTYKEAKNSIVSLEFMHYRLVELERLRCNGTNHA